MTISEILRTAATAIEECDEGEPIGATSAIITTADSVYAADVTMRHLARHLRYPDNEQPLPHLIRWSSLETDEQVVAAMRAAATAAEQRDV